MTGKERVLAMLEGRPVDHLPLMPITMMFAARQIGAKYSRYALDYRVMAEAQLYTAAKFGFDHVSAISETREAPDCGAYVQYFEDQPYVIDETHALLADKAALKDLPLPDPLGGGHMTDRIRAVARMRQHVGQERIVEGWVEGPCGASADLRGINALMLDFYDDPSFVHELFALVTALALRFAREQIMAGADLIGIGDPAASLVGPRIYREFVWPYEKKLVDGVHAAGARVRLHICGNTRRILGLIGRLGCDLVDVDAVVPVAEARAAMGPEPVLLGGVDPVRILQQGTRQEVLAAVAESHRQAGSRYILGAGCEITRDTPEENLRALAAYALAH